MHETQLLLLCSTVQHLMSSTSTCQVILAQGCVAFGRNTEHAIYLLIPLLQSTGKNTFFGKTASLLQSVDGLGHLQKILLKIMAVLVVLSFVLCVTLLFYLIFYGHEHVKEAITFVAVVLVASIPIAIEIVCTATLALGSRQLSERGAIVTRLASIEEMAGMNMLCSDKTGTLTLNKMVIQVCTGVAVCTRVCRFVFSTCTEDGDVLLPLHTCNCNKQAVRSACILHMAVLFLFAGGLPHLHPRL